jgi:signal peptidase I
MTPTDADPPHGDPHPEPLRPAPSEWDEGLPSPGTSGDRYREERRRTEYESRGAMSTGRWMWEGVKAISTAIVLFLLIRTFLVEAFKIPTGSMENTLLVGDFLLVNKAVYGAEIPATHARLPGITAPHRNDVIVFLPPHDPTKNYVKRIVGVAGDTLQMRDKLLYLNGEPQREPWARNIDPFTDPSDPRMRWQGDFLVKPPRNPRDYRPTRDNWGPLVVPVGKYFALGDNRDNSEDSRYWGFLDEAAIKGRPIFVYYSYAKDPLDPFSWISAIRWARIGDIIR